MSKEKPEVGDVWKNNMFGNKLYITGVSCNHIDFIIFDKDDEYKPYFTNTFSKIRKDERFDRFTERNTYLGKSKASINDLFEVVE